MKDKELVKCLIPRWKW